MSLSLKVDGVEDSEKATRCRMANSVFSSASTIPAPRVRQSAQLIINGHDLLGHPFSEDAESFDVSSSGISFYMKNRPWIEDPLQITIFPSEEADLAHLVGRKRLGRVVRTGEVDDDRQFVAARFD